VSSIHSSNNIAPADETRARELLAEVIKLDQATCSISVAQASTPEVRTCGWVICGGKASVDLGETMSVEFKDNKQMARFLCEAHDTAAIKKVKVKS
jgi:hypothetical protein